MKTYEIAVQPPPFKLTGARSGPNGFAARICFDTPHGPASLDVGMTVPEYYRSLIIELFHRALHKACLSHIAWKAKQRGNSAGFLGMKLPSPRKMIAKAARTITKTAKAAVNKVYAALPSPVRAVVGPILKQVAGAVNPTILANLVKPLVAKLGSTKIPGTNIPLMALSPIGAAAYFGQQVIGREATQALLDEAYVNADTILGIPQSVSAGGPPPIKRRAGPPPIKRGSMGDRLGRAMVAQKAHTLAKAVSSDGAFARSVGLPTLNVAPNLEDAAKTLVQVLRGVYKGDEARLTQLRTLASKAQAGDEQARALWTLALAISDAARQVKAGYSVGDGYGPGYGVSGYRPSAPSALGY